MTIIPKMDNPASPVTTGPNTKLMQSRVVHFKARIKRLILGPSDSGRFEVRLDGALVYLKLVSGWHLFAEIPGNA